MQLKNIIFILFEFDLVLKEFPLLKIWNTHHEILYISLNLSSSVLEGTLVACL